MRNKAFLKIIAFGTFVLIVPIFPWWSVLFLLFICTVLFKAFYIGVAIGLMMDLMYGAMSGFGFPFLFTVLSFILVFLIPLAKRYFAFPSALDF